MKNLFVIGSVTVLIVTSCQNQSEKKVSPPVKTATTESKTDTTIVIAPPPSITKTNWSITYKKGKMSLMGKEIPFDKLTPALTDTFTNIAKTGKNLPKAQDFEFKFDENALMGVRGEIKSSVDDARDAAMIRAMSTTDKPEIMVKNFYALYTDRINRTSDPIEKKILNACLSDALVKSLAAEKEIDEDYFLKAQDVGEDWADTITIQQVTNTPNKVSLTVKMGAQNLNRTLLVDLVKNKKVWVIDKVSASK
jgi:hypothetical protein